MTHAEYFGRIEAGAGLDYLNGLNPEIGFDSYQDFIKAISANTGTPAGGTDVSLLTGGAALRLQSIDKLLHESIQQDRHFLLLNDLLGGRAGATIHEWTVKEQIGGFPGSGFASEDGEIPESQGTYERRTAEVKFIHTRRSVTYAQTRQNTIADTVAKENLDAIREVKTSAEWGLIYGDSASNALEYDGVVKQMLDLNDVDLVKDNRAKGLTFGGDDVLNIAKAISDFEHFGQATHIYCSPTTGTAEFDQKLNPVLRVGLENSRASKDIEMGTPVTAVRAPDDVRMTLRRNVFIREGEMPFEARAGKYPEIVTSAGLTAPATVTPGTPGADAQSQFTAEHEGLYYYAVESRGQKGRSTATLSAQVSIAAGQSVQLTIADPADANVHSFVIHRSRKDGTNAKNDVREMIVIPKTVGGPTLWTDRNDRIPGTSVVLVLNQSPADEAIVFRQLFPMVQFPLFPTSAPIKPWAQLFSGVLQFTKRKQHGLIYNVLPDNATWRPFN